MKTVAAITKLRPIGPTKVPTRPSRFHSLAVRRSGQPPQRGQEEAAPAMRPCRGRNWTTCSGISRSWLREAAFHWPVLEIIPRAACLTGSQWAHNLLFRSLQKKSSLISSNRSGVSQISFFRSSTALIFAPSSAGEYGLPINSTSASRRP